MCYETMKNWFLKALYPHNIEYLICIGLNDPQRNEYENLFRYSQAKLIYADNPETWYVEQVNKGASVASGDIFIVGSDDFDCPEQWDSLLLAEIAGKTDFVLKTQDGAQPWIITIPIMDRVFYERNNYIYYPEYKHMYSDTDLTSYADYTGTKITSSLQFFHNHYTVTGKKDQVSERADSTYPTGEALYLRRFRENFGVPESEIKGRITEPSHLQWMRQRGVTL